jgi:DNA adenine methylase
MKTSFNGIWQTCVDSHGRFGTPAGLVNQKDRIFDAENIRMWSKALQNTEISSLDYNSLDIPPNSLIVCDPPYRGSFTSYGTVFDDKEQIRLVKTCKEWKENSNQVYLANRECDDLFFEGLLPDSKIDKFPVVYTAGRRKKTDDGFSAKKATEILIRI